MFEIVSSDGAVREVFNAVTPAMAWLVNKAREYNDGYVTWFEREDAEPDTIIMMCIAGIYFKLRKLKHTYTVEIDGVQSNVMALSLAEVANQIRGKGKRFKVWSPVGLPLIDTLHGDNYALIKN